MEINSFSTSYNKTINNTSDLMVQKENTSLDMNDFLSLLVAQMSNQDALNPMDNTEYVSQLAQFSSLQAMTDLANVAAQGQATSLIGKNVVLSSYDNKGILVYEEGIVEKVTILSGKVNLVVNGKLFSMEDVKEIKSDDLAVEKLSSELSETNELNQTNELIETIENEI